jgi:hypothetical protein
MSNASPLSDKSLANLRDAANRLAANEGSIEYQMNLACWLGERAHALIAEIDRLREELSCEDGYRKAGDMVTVAYAIRDAARKAVDSKLAKDHEELDRLIAVFNLPAEQMYDAAFRTAEYQRRKDVGSTKGGA